MTINEDRLHNIKSEFIYIVELTNVKFFYIKSWNQEEEEEIRA